MVNINNNCYFVKTLTHNKSSFRKHLGIRSKSYMATVATRLYEHYYMNSISLWREFRKYYYDEFETFREFLAQKHNLRPNEIENFLSKKSHYKDLSISPDLSIDELMNDDSIRAAVISFERRHTE